jgi:hypothetical protein
MPRVGGQLRAAIDAISVPPVWSAPDGMGADGTDVRYDTDGDYVYMIAGVGVIPCNIAPGSSRIGRDCSQTYIARSRKPLGNFNSSARQVHDYPEGYAWIYQPLNDVPQLMGVFGPRFQQKEQPNIQLEHLAYPFQ